MIKIIEGQHNDWHRSADGKPTKPQSKPQLSKWDDPKWHARQAKIHDLWDRQKREANEKGEPEPKAPQEYDSKWTPQKAVECEERKHGEKLPF